MAIARCQYSRKSDSPDIVFVVFDTLPIPFARWDQEMFGYEL